METNKVWDAQDKMAHAARAQMVFLGALEKMDRCCLQAFWDSNPQ